nr:aminotransferase [Chloroflexia bacterium]
VAARVIELTGLPSISPLTTDWVSQMVAMPIPPVDPVALAARLLDEYGIEVPSTRHGDQLMVRVSVQGYVTDEDLDALVGALRALLPPA